MGTLARAHIQAHARAITHAIAICIAIANLDEVDHSNVALAMWGEEFVPLPSHRRLSDERPLLLGRRGGALVTV